ncbi:MAG: hypothetical protein HWQ23_21440 [Nostoc sp. JL33]|nr:hypothetical protein [Nostoc sp. JL33]
MTKTNQNVRLELESLALATPNPNNIQGLVEYLTLSGLKPRRFLDL